MSYNRNSVKGAYIGDHIRFYGDYIGQHHMKSGGFEGGVGPA